MLDRNHKKPDCRETTWAYMYLLNYEFLSFLLIAEDYQKNIEARQIIRQAIALDVFDMAKKE